MTALIEPYSAYVLGYLLVGLAIHLGVCTAHIKIDLEGSNRYLPTDLSFISVLLIYMAGPSVLFVFLVVSTGEIIWDALKAWKKFGRKASGTTELILAGFWSYMAWTVSVDMDTQGRWVFVLVCAITALFLLQSARAIQQLKE